MSIKTITQPPFVVTTFAEMDNTMPDDSIFYVKNLKRLYQLMSGTFYPLSSGSLNATLMFIGTIAGGAGNVVFYTTDDGLIGGNALFSSVASIIPMFDVADPLKAFSKAVVSNGTKTITTNCKLTQQNLVTILGISVIGSTTLANAPDGVTLTFLVTGVLV